MSIIVEDYMRTEMGLAGIQLLAYANIIKHIQNGYCTVTQPQMAEEIGVCLKTMNNIIREFKKKNIITVKPYRDGSLKRIVIKPNDIHIQFKANEFTSSMLEYWNKRLNLNEQISLPIYTALLKAAAVLEKQGLDKMELKKAIDRYSCILSDKLYYKSHIYKFVNFLSYKLADYLENGAEWQEYLVDYNKRNRNSFTQVDRDSDPMKIYRGSVADEELGNMEM